MMITTTTAQKRIRFQFKGSPPSPRGPHRPGRPCLGRSAHASALMPARHVPTDRREQRGAERHGHLAESERRACACRRRSSSRIVISPSEARCTLGHVVESILLTEHPDLAQAATDLTAHVATAKGRIVPRADVAHDQHFQFGKRLSLLHTYLSAALLEVDHDLYMPAFVNLRTALEHHVQDHLLFLANRYKPPVLTGVSDDTLADWQNAIEEGREGFASVLQVQRVGRGTKVEVIRSGPHYVGGEQGLDAPALSVYYQLMHDYDPFTGGKNAQDFIGRWQHSKDAQRRWAAQTAETWREFLHWPALMAYLLLNEFYKEKEIARFNVHYGFLSAFTHPTMRGRDIVYGRNPPTTLRYDHYTSELILLYIITIARLELESFEEMSRQEPPVNLAGWDEVREDMERGEVLAAHLWFPRGAPHLYDRVQEANRRGEREDGGPIPWDERQKPEELTDDEVLYYANPLRRLIELHNHQNELTGFPYDSAWLRGDAQMRSLD
jgi:hypothetical protein